MSKQIESIEQQLERVQSELSHRREHAISQDDFARWRQNQVTEMFFLELSESYLENLSDEPVVVACVEKVGHDSWMKHTNPVEETAINSALKAGRNQVLETLLDYEPINLDREEVEDD